MYTHIHMSTCRLQLRTTHWMLLWVLFYVLLSIPLFFFACYTTPRRTSFHSTFWTYLPFFASYKCLGCLSLSLTSHLRRLCLSAGLQVTVPLLLAGKGFIWNARSAEKEWQEKSLLLLPLLPEANAQSKTKQSTTQQQQKLRPEIAAEPSRADPQPHSSSGCGLQRWWLRGTRARSDDPMTKRRQHTRTCGRLGLAKRRRCRCRCRCM